jgi:AAA+ superfamily predicted ATPase
LSSSDGRRQLTIEGIIPGASAGDAEALRSKILSLVQRIIGPHERSGRPLDPFSLLVRYTDLDAVGIDPSWQPGDRGQLGNGALPKSPPSPDDVPEFVAMEPSYRLDQVVLPEATREALLDCVSFVEVAPMVFDDWGLRAIEPHPSIAVNFRGPPGTGKTIAAHAAASHLGKKIMLSRVSDLESKYYGQGPKNLVGLFESAKAQDAVIFIDEAESLLSRRYAQPEQAAESAINSMRTELLMALDSFDGLVIFASNLPDSYDVAIESRLLHVDFALPDRASRLAIWRLHLPPKLPLEPGCVSVERLAEADGVTGRDIKLAVIRAAVGVARRSDQWITEEMLTSTLESQRGTHQRASSAPGAVAAEGSGPVLNEEEIAGKIRERLQVHGDS